MRIVKMLMFYGIVFCLFAVSTKVYGVEYYTGETEARWFSTYLSGSYGDSSFTTHPNVEIDATVDWAGRSILFNSINIYHPASTQIFAEEFTIGPGQTSTITTELTIGDFSLHSLDVGPLELFPIAGERYVIEDLTSAIFQDFMLTGLYEIQGPSESEVGDFAVVVTNWRSWFDFELDTTGYPGQIVMDGYFREDSEYNSSPPYVFQLTDVIVDNVPIEIYGRGTDFQVDSIVLTPEPSILLLLGLGVMMLRKRR